jgi:hypothetical protein
MRHYDSSVTATATAAASRAYLNIWSLVLSFIAYKLQGRELVFNSIACPAALVTLNALFVLIATVKLDYLLDMVRDSCYPPLYYLLRYIFLYLSLCLLYILAIRRRVSRGCSSLQLIPSWFYSIKIWRIIRLK